MTEGDTIQVHVKLYSILREKLPPQDKGETDLTLTQGATLRDLLDELEIEQRVVVGINEEHIDDRQYQLKDGDTVKVFSSISGG